MRARCITAFAHSGERASTASGTSPRLVGDNKEEGERERVRQREGQKEGRSGREGERGRGRENLCTCVGRAQRVCVRALTFPRDHAGVTDWSDVIMPRCNRLE